MQIDRLHIKKTRDIANPHYYVQALKGEFSEFAYDEEEAPLFKGQWREKLLLQATHPVDLEIGIGNGYFFTHQAECRPDRFLLGIEVKFKPIIQSVRRAQNRCCKNIRAMRYDARLISHLFAHNELNNVYIHHPDPWENRRKHKHRLMSADFFNQLYDIQQAGSFVDIKTDSHDYFLWTLKELGQSRYQIIRKSEDLHSSEWSNENFVTHFESIFIKQKMLINYLRLHKN